MVATLPADLSLRYEALRSTLDGLGPRGYADARERHARAFAEMGYPTRRDEEFRYLDFTGVAATDYEVAYGANLDRSVLADVPFGGLDAVRLTFVNGQFAPDLSTEETLPDGIFVGTLESAFDAGVPGTERLGSIATLRGKLGKTNDERFVHLNGAYLTEAAYIHVPRGMSLDRTVHVLFLTAADHGPIAVFPRVLVTVEEAATLKLVESHVGLRGKALVVPVVEVDIAKGANVEHIRHVAEGADTVHVGRVAARQAADSVYTSVSANLGGRIVRHDIDSFHTGSHLETWLDGASVARQDETVDNHTRIDHAQPDGRSFETYKTILDGDGHGIFNGKIYVYEDAQRTDAKQTNQGLLLSPTAKFDTKPQLEIFADDVKCTHGATVGRLRDDALFYLRARGIPESQAKALLIQAFAAEAFARVSREDVREELHSALLKKLA